MSSSTSEGPSPHTTMASGRNVAWLLDTRAHQRGDHPFLIWEPFDGPPRTWSYREFARASMDIAAGLQARGIGLGDRLILHADNSPEYLQALFACARIGAVAVCTNTRSVRDELEYFASHSGAVAAITQPRYADLVGRCIPTAKWIALTDSDTGDTPAPGTAPGRQEAFASLVHKGGATAPARPDPFAAASIQYTSGTTARPKGVVWTHANWLWAAQVSATHESLTRDDVHLVYAPLFHTNAQSYSTLATLWAGATMVLQPKFSVTRFWEVSQRHHCTWSSMLTFAIKALHDQEVPAHSYRLWGSGATSPGDSERFGVRVIGWWGMTETVTHGLVDDVHAPGTALNCGRPANEYEVSVLRPDGVPVEPGETGLLFVRGVPGVSLFAEYLDDPDATSAAVDEHGWLSTGDLVTPNHDGSMRFADREKDILKVGGENVAASEVERVIGVVPGVSEVAVVAGPHQMLSEVPIAFVVPGSDTDGSSLVESVYAACRNLLSDFKVPREVRLVDDLPRSTLNKVAKAELRRQLVAEQTGGGGPAHAV